MSVITGTVVVNAAFLKEIKEDNRELRRILSEVARAFDSLDTGRSATRCLVQLLCELRDQLAVHFSLEEAYGYFDDALEASPRLSERAAELRDEHKSLFQTVCDLVDEAERVLYREPPLHTQRKIAWHFMDFRQLFQQHEARENELILESLDQDIGVGD